MRIGYASASYLSRRNIIGAVPEAEYRQVMDLYRFARIASVPFNRVIGRRSSLLLDLPFKFRECGAGDLDLIHLFNAVSAGPTPWCTTFETVVPRYSATMGCHHGSRPGYEAAVRAPAVRRAMRALADCRCRRVIAMSECAAVMQRELLSHFGDIGRRVERKVFVLLPPQAALVPNPERKPSARRGPVRMMFVGAAFFRKGGLEILETLQRMREHEGCDLELTIVSSLLIDPYAAHEGPQEVRRAQDLIRRGGHWIRHFPRLPNPDVLALMRSAHVGLLPTYADTFGFAVLEFQAAACPVITTDVRALPEINDDETGWVIPVPKNRLGEALSATAEERRELSGHIRAGLEHAVRAICADRNRIVVKGARALQRIRGHHAPAAFAERLRQIYAEAIGGSDADRTSPARP